MAYFEMILMVAVVLVGLIGLALVVSSGPVSHRHPAHPRSVRTSGPPARPWSLSTPAGAVPLSRRAPRRHGASRCTRHTVDWSPLMDTSARRTPTTEADR